MSLESSNLVKVLTAILVASVVTLSFAHADNAECSGTAEPVNEGAKPFRRTYQ